MATIAFHRRRRRRRRRQPPPPLRSFFSTHPIRPPSSRNQAERKTSLRLPVGIPSYSLAFNRKVMPQLRPAGRGVAFHGAADRPAELNFNYRVLSTVRRSKTERLCVKKLRFSFSSSRFENPSWRNFWKDSLWLSYAHKVSMFII